MLLHTLTLSQHAEIVPPVDNLEAGWRKMTKELSFYSSIEKTESDMPKLPWEVVVSKVVAKADVTKSLYTDVEDCLEQRLIDDEAKFAMNHLIAEELMMPVEESLDDILRTLPFNDQSGVRSVV